MYSMSVACATLSQTINCEDTIVKKTYSNRYVRLHFAAIYNDGRGVHTTCRKLAQKLVWTLRRPNKNGRNAEQRRRRVRYLRREREDFGTF